MNIRPHILNKCEIGGHIKGLVLTKSGVEDLAFRLKKWILLRKDFKLTVCRKHYEDFEVYFGRC